MKIKQQQQQQQQQQQHQHQVANLSSQNLTGATTNITNSNNTTMTFANNQTSNSNSPQIFVETLTTNSPVAMGGPDLLLSLSPSFNNTTILTRSAAVRQKQHQQKSSSSSLTSAAAVPLVASANVKQRSGGGPSHHQCGGKIVKPIPVRPISSSASSTHSSSANSCLHSILKSTAESSSNQQQQQHQQQTTVIGAATVVDQMSQFSLIAKYFASFPATRLKNNHQDSQPAAPTNCSSGLAAQINTISGTTTPFSRPLRQHAIADNNNDLFEKTRSAHATATSTNQTPFLPFKKVYIHNHTFILFN